MNDGITASGLTIVISATKERSVTFQRGGTAGIVAPAAPPAVPPPARRQTPLCDGARPTLGGTARHPPALLLRPSPILRAAAPTDPPTTPPVPPALPPPGNTTALPHA